MGCRAAVPVGEGGPTTTAARPITCAAMVTTRGAMAVLTEPVFRRFFLGRTISAFGGGITTLALTFAVLDLGGSPGELGVVLGASAVPALALMLLGGVAGDRWERRRILVGTDVVMGACQALTAGLLLSGVAEIWHLVALQLVGGAASAFFSPASTGIVPDVVSGGRVQQANSLLGMARNLMQVIGPAVAGVIVALASPGWALAADALTFFTSALLLSRLPRSVGHVQAGMTILGDVARGWREFTSRSWVWLMVLSFSAYQATVLPAIFVLGPILADRELGGAAAWALVLSVRAVGAVAVGAVLLVWRPRRPLVASTLIILLDVPFLLCLSVGAPVVLVAAAGAFSSAGVVAADTLWETALQENVPAEVLSRVSSYDWLGSLAMNPAGFALIGVVATAYGVSAVLVAVIAAHVAVRLLLVTAPSIRGVAAST